MKKQLRIGLLIFLLVTFFCGNVLLAADYTLKLAHNLPPKKDASYHVWFLDFAALAKKYSNGAVDLKEFPSAQMGTDTVAAKKVQLGALDMQIVAANNLASLYNGFDLFTLPFLIKSEQCGVDKVLSDNGLRELISKEAEKKANIRVLSWSYAGMRNMMNSKHAILKPGDLKGLRMRVAKNPILLDTYKALGGSPIGIASKETYSALQTKVVDGNDGGVAWAYANKFYEVQKYYTITGHQMVFMPMIINNKIFMGLPEAVQKAVQKAALESAANNRQYMLKKGNEMVADMGKKGLEIARPDLAAFREAVGPVWEKYAERVGGMKRIETVLDLQADCK